AVGDLIGGLERAAVVTRFAVDPDADLHLAVVEGEGGLAGRGEDGGGEADAHSAGAIHGALGDLGDGVETVAALRRGAGGLVGEEQPGHAASGGGLLRRRGEDVIRADDGRGAHPIGGGEIGGEV